MVGGALGFVVLGERRDGERQEEDNPESCLVSIMQREYIVAMKRRDFVATVAAGLAATGVVAAQAPTPVKRNNRLKQRLHAH